MARDPVVVRCDFCHNAIKTDEPWSSLNVVVPHDVAETVARENEIAIRRQLGPMAQMLDLTHAVTPRHCTLEMCEPCRKDRLPETGDIVALLVSVQMDEQRKRASKRNAKPLFKEE